MNINSSIVDQRLTGIQAEIADQAQRELNVTGDKLRSLAFVYLCVKTILDLDPDECFECLTEGGGDFGVDALHVTDEVDGEFVVTLFQCKYRTKLDGEANFPESGINDLVLAIRHIFDPSSTLGTINSRLLAKVENVRSMIRDGLLPRVRAIAGINGMKWNKAAQAAIDRAEFGDQVSWELVNHDRIVHILQSIRPVNDTLRFQGKAVVEDMNFSRVCIGRMPVSEVAALMSNHGDRLLERNIRRYLGLHGNRVNQGIRATLRSAQPSDFYFFNNGLTLVCDDFSYNALQQADYQIKVENLQIVNGGQTCMTIFKTGEELAKEGKQLPAEAAILVRLYKLPKDNSDTVLRITNATNSQNPVDLKDLHSNDQAQVQLEQSIQDLGFTYRRKRMDGMPKSTEITSGTAAEAILSVWRKAPNQAKFFIREHFGKLYDRIFTKDLNGAQVILAVLVYRYAENHRRRPDETDPPFVRYASCFIAMQMGGHLLARTGKTLEQVDHRSFQEVKTHFDVNAGEIYRLAIRDVEGALGALYGPQANNISLQQLSATFRRGDLIERLTSRMAGRQ